MRQWRVAAPPTAHYAPPSNVQEFTAKVTTTASSGRAIRNVALFVDGVSTDMTSLGSGNYETKRALPVCHGVITYYYEVHSGPDGSPTPDATERYPSAGSFTRAIDQQPASCAGGQGSTTFTVTFSADLWDFAPGDGFCSTTKDPKDPKSECTLRAAVMEANAKPGFDRIVLPSTWTFPLTRADVDGDEKDDLAIDRVGDLDITDSVVIESDDAKSGCKTNLGAFLDASHHFAQIPFSTPSVLATIDAGGLDRVFDIYPGAQGPTEVHLSCLEITGGVVKDASHTGPRRFGGGIANRATLVLDRVVVIGNTMSGMTAGVGISNTGALSLVESALLYNLGDDGGAVVGGTDGGAIYNGSSAVLSAERSLFAYNRAARGPGILNDRASDTKGGALTLINSTVHSNKGGDSADQLGAAVFNRGSAQLSWSTLSGNNELGGAAGVVLASAGTLRLENSLVFSDDSPDRPACMSGPDGITTAVGVRTTDINCIPVAYRGIFHNVVQSGFIRGVWTELTMQGGGVTPVLPITSANAVETQADVPVDKSFDVGDCPAVDQRNRPRPGAGSAICDPGAMEMQPDDL